MNFRFCTSGEFLNWLHDCKMHWRRFCIMRSFMELIEYSVLLCCHNDCHYLCAAAANREPTAAAAGGAAGGRIKWISRPISEGPSIQSGRGRNDICGTAGASGPATHSSGNITPARNSAGGNTEPVPAHGGNCKFLTSFALSGLDVSFLLLGNISLWCYSILVSICPFLCLPTCVFWTKWQIFNNQSSTHSFACLWQVRNGSWMEKCLNLSVNILSRCLFLFLYRFWTLRHSEWYMLYNILQGVSGGIVNILEGDSMDYSK